MAIAQISSLGSMGLINLGVAYYLSVIHKKNRDAQGKNAPDIPSDSPCVVLTAKLCTFFAGIFNIIGAIIRLQTVDLTHFDTRVDQDPLSLFVACTFVLAAGFDFLALYRLLKPVEGAAADEEMILDGEREWIMDVKMAAMVAKDRRIVVVGSEEEKKALVG